MGLILNDTQPTPEAMLAAQQALEKEHPPIKQTVLDRDKLQAMLNDRISELQASITDILEPAEPSEFMACCACV